VEILVDNDHASNVSITGNWTTEPKGSYGPSMLTTDGKGGTVKSIRLIPPVTKSGSYRVYAYFPKVQNATSKTVVTIFDGKAKKEKVIKESDVRVEGQTTGEWVPLGTYSLSKGRKSYVEISNKDADGVVVADAVLFIPDTRK
ncbi:MAG: xanthan lyase, partial [Segetibacter sp.]